jgi:hypothetical protein
VCGRSVGQSPYLGGVLGPGPNRSGAGGRLRRASGFVTLGGTQPPLCAVD